MSEAVLVRFSFPQDGTRIGLVLDGTVHDITTEVESVAAWLRDSAGRVPQAVDALISAAQQAGQAYPLHAIDPSHWLPPVDTQDVWAAGVTYERSRAARQEEAIDGGDIYARVYAAERPELFYKARGRRSSAPWGEVGIRSDSAWNVPEPELGLVINPALEVVGITIGNDMSSRDIEGANPLYLPQAKVYTASCALGPGIVLRHLTDWPPVTISLSIERESQIVFSGTVHTDRIKRGLGEQVSYLGRSNTFPDGVILLTGTGIVPPPDFTLAPGDVIRITIEGIGELVNTVRVV